MPVSSRCSSSAKPSFGDGRRHYDGGDAPWLETHGYRRADLDAFHLRWSGDFVLDGEPYEGGELTIRQGPSLEFVIP